MRNEIAYNKLQRHADYMIITSAGYIPPKYSRPSQWLNVDKIITEIKTIHFDDFHNAAMIFSIFEILTWQVALDIITREKLTEFIDALSENPLFEPTVNFIIAAQKLP